MLELLVATTPIGVKFGVRGISFLALLIFNKQFSLWISFFSDEYALYIQNQFHLKDKGSDKEKERLHFAENRKFFEKQKKKMTIPWRFTWRKQYDEAMHCQL